MVHIMPADDPKQALRIKRFLMAAGTYIIWMLIALYCYYNGLFTRILGSIFLIFTLIITTNLIFYFMFRTGLNLRFKDPSLTMIQMVLATVWTMLMAYSMDEGRGIMLLLYMVVFTFGTFRLKFRQFCFLSVFALMGYSSVITFLLINHPESINLRVELLYLGTLFTVLLWFSVIGSYINVLREKLSKVNNELINTNNELNNANAIIKQSEERFRDLADLLPDTVFETDSEGKLTYVNRSAFDQFGYIPDDLKGGPTVFDVIVPEDHDTLRRNINSIFSGEKIGLTEYTARRKDDTPFPAMAHTTRIVRDGKPVGLRGFFIDITEKKNLEEQLMRAQKMEAIGTLAGGIAHDFNNLLMGILGNVSLVLMSMDKNNPLYDRLKNVEGYINRAADLTKQLLGFARGGKYEPKPTDLGEFIRTTSEMFGRTKKEIQIHFKTKDGLWTVEVDHGQMEQVLLNLFVNAWQAMPEGGELHITTENCVLSESDAGPYELKPGRYVKVMVTDTGSGMDEATQTKIFEPFFSTKERGRGTGLGLASAYGIIKNHGGIILVESKKGAGTTFTIYLPASDKSVETEKKDMEHTLRSKETILLIDDEKMILDVASEMLKGLGFRVIVANSGQQGLQVYEKNSNTIDLVILDMIMPTLSGKETFERLHDINPSLKVLLSSGYSLDGQAEQIIKKGCKGFIQKPFSMGELSERIRAVLAKP